DPSTPALRVYSEGSGRRIIYDHIVSFQGHYLARQIQIFVGTKLVAEINIDLIESLKESPDSVLAVPSSAIPVDLTQIRFKEGSASLWPVLLKKSVPVYPQEAKPRRI